MLVCVLTRVLTNGYRRYRMRLISYAKRGMAEGVGFEPTVGYCVLDTLRPGHTGKALPDSSLSSAVFGLAVVHERLRRA
jgi:hypothetical protein